MTSWWKRIIQKQKVEALGKEPQPRLSPVILLTSPGCTEVPAARSNTVSFCHRGTWTLSLRACLAPYQAAQPSSVFEVLLLPHALLSPHSGLQACSYELNMTSSCTEWLLCLQSSVWHFLWLIKVTSWHEPWTRVGICGGQNNGSPKVSKP